MAAYLIAHITINDLEKWSEFADKVGPTLAAFNVERILYGKRSAVLAGKHDYTAVSVYKFASSEDINKWYNSDAYQALIELRDSAADVTFIAYDEVL